jgi:hypothetical protein
VLGAHAVGEHPLAVGGELADRACGVEEDERRVGVVCSDAAQRSPSAARATEPGAHQRAVAGGVGAALLDLLCGGTGGRRAARGVAEHGSRLDLTGSAVSDRLA